MNSDVFRDSRRKTRLIPLISLIIAIAALINVSSIGIARDASMRNAVIFDSSRQVGDSNNFNWFVRGATRENGAQQAMWEPLFILDDRKGTLQPWLGVEILPNAKQDIWTLKLRKDVFWSDNKPFTAADAVFTANLAIQHDELPAAEAVTFRSQVESVKKIDDLTVTFKLRVPNPRFAIENFGGSIFSSFLIMPEHIWKGKNPLTFKFENPIGTGPYKLLSIEGEKVVWQRDDNWWGSRKDPVTNQIEFMPLPKPQQLIWLYSPDLATSVARLKNNEIDAGPELSFDDMEALKTANPKIIGWDSASPKAWSDSRGRQLELNVDPEYRKDHPDSHWDNPKLRLALSLLIDRQKIADIAYNGSTIPSRTMFLENGAMAPVIDAVVAAGYGLSSNANADAGRKLIEEVGYTKGADNIYQMNGKPLTLAINVNDDLEQDTKAVRELVGQLKAVGIAARAVPVTTAELWGKVIPPGNYEAVYSWLSRGSIVEPFTSMSRYTSDKYAKLGDRSPGFNNTGRWNTAATVGYSEAIDEIGKMPLQIEQAAAAGVPPKQLANPDILARTVEAYKILSEEMPFVPIVQSSMIIPFNTTHWTGWPTNDDNYCAPVHSWSRTLLILHHLRKVP